MIKTIFFVTAMMGVLCLGFWLAPGYAGAHCDTLEGPVVVTARAALEKGDVTPLLKWVKKENEIEIKEAFKKTLAVRKLGKEAKGLADMYFFETLVRIHRAGEGAPYTGLKPGTAIEPSVAAADEALDTGSADKLVKMVTNAVSMGIRERFEHAGETKKHADESVEEGRKFVEAYVEFTHYVERLHMDAMGPSGHSKAEEGMKEEHHHH